MTNDYEVRGDTSAIFLRKRDGSKLEVLIDTADLPRVQAFPGRWYATRRPGEYTFYAQGQTAPHNQRTFVLLHRLILDIPKGSRIDVDHINHNGLDNRRCNLRVVKHWVNQHNRRGANASNRSSGLRGVSWCQGNGTWHASLIINKHYFHLGYFAEKQDAAAAIKAKLASRNL